MKYPARNHPQPWENLFNDLPEHVKRAILKHGPMPDIDAYMAAAWAVIAYYSALGNDGTL